MGKSGNPARAAQQAAEAETDPTVYAPTPVDENGVEDFDAFWEQHDERPRVKVRAFGQVVELPPAIPLHFQVVAKRMKRSKRLEDMQLLSSLLFGEGAAEKWAEAGLDTDQYSLLLAWAPQRITLGDKSKSMAEVAAALADHTKASAPKGDADPT